MRGRGGRYIEMMLGAVLLLPLVLILLLLIGLQVTHYWTYWERRRQADIYVSQIEQWKSELGAYPDPRTQTIVPFFSPYYYGSDGHQYCIGFMIYFDDDYTYCSTTREWKEGLGIIFPWPAGQDWPAEDEKRQTGH
jgi:hypothetical protein